MVRCHALVQTTEGRVMRYGDIRSCKSEIAGTSDIVKRFWRRVVKITTEPGSTIECPKRWPGICPSPPPERSAPRVKNLPPIASMTVMTRLIETVIAWAVLHLTTQNRSRSDEINSVDDVRRCRPGESGSPVTLPSSRVPRQRVTRKGSSNAFSLLTEHFKAH